MNREQIILLREKNLRYMRRNATSRRYYKVAKIAEMCGVSKNTISLRFKEYKIR